METSSMISAALRDMQKMGVENDSMDSLSAENQNVNHFGQIA